MSDLWRLTAGEHALVCLDNIRLIAEQDAEATDERGRELGSAAVAFVRSSFGLMAKFPRPSRDDFAKSLPFTNLEQAVFRRTPNALVDAEVRERLVHRLGAWVREGCAMVEGRAVLCGDFLRRLQPNLDEHYNRDLAGEMADDMDRLAMDAVS